MPLWNSPVRAKFYRIASERPFHYLGSGKMMFLMGHDFGEAMVELLKKVSAADRTLPRARLAHGSSLGRWLGISNTPSLNGGENRE